MFDFPSIDLCHTSSDVVSVYVRAEVKGGRLVVSGQDMGKSVEGFWGKDDYEYYYFFDEENTEKLFLSLQIIDNPAVGLQKKFNGTSAVRELRNFCDEHQIVYRFDTW